MAEVTKQKGVWTVKDSEGNLTELYPAGKEIDSVSGSQLVIEDSRAGALRINKTFGKSEQRKTSGAQLFDASKLATTSAGGATVTNNGDGSFTISGSGTMSSDFSLAHLYSHEETLKSLKAGSLHLTCEKATSPYFYAAILDGSGNVLMEVNNRKTTSAHIDITGELLLTDDIQMRIGLYGPTGDTITPGTIKPMLYFDGDSDGTWEPYTGNMPAPNPQYRQPIVSVGDSGSVETEVLSGNLFDIDAGAINTAFYDGTGNLHGGTTSVKVLTIPCKADASYAVEILGAGGTGKYLRIACLTSEKTFINRPVLIENIGSRVFTTPENCAYLEIAWDTDVTKIMLNYGTEPLSYQPYTKQSLTINKPNGFPGIEVTDASLANYIDADGKMWCCDTREWDRGVDVKRVAVETITTDTISSVNNEAGYNSSVLFRITPTKKFEAIAYAAILCEQYIGATSYEEIYHSSNFAIAINYSGQVIIKNPNCTTNEEIRAEIDANPIVLHYILATPIETPIPEAEMAAWRAMHSNEPTTTILSDADVEVEYPTSRVGAVALDADMRSRENERKSSVIFIGDYTTDRYVDFDGLTEDGVYDFNAAYITNAYNAPIYNETGTLTVKHGETTGYITQMYQSRTGNVFVRFYNNATWMTWERLAKSSDVEVVTNTHAEIGISTAYIKVYATLGMVKLSRDRAIITINYQITENNESSDVYEFLSIDKIKEALDIPNLAFLPHMTTVILHPVIEHTEGTLIENTSYATRKMRGYTGLMLGDSGGLGRIWNNDGDFGAWALDTSVYKIGTYGTIIINGAYIGEAGDS